MCEFQSDTEHTLLGHFPLKNELTVKHVHLFASKSNLRPKQEKTTIEVRMSHKVQQSLSSNKISRT